MKKLFLTLTLLFTFSVAFAGSSSTPLIIYDSCGSSYEFDDTGMTWDQIFDQAEGLDWYFCQGGAELLDMLG